MKKLLFNLSKKKTITITLACILSICLIISIIIIGYTKYLESTMPVVSFSNIYDSISETVADTSKSVSGAIQDIGYASEAALDSIMYNTKSSIVNKGMTSSNNCSEPHICIPPIDTNIDPSKIYENDFKDTKTFPLSTFSSDVDTASYVTFRQLVTYGYTKERMNYETFRAEEFLNYFNYNYTNPKTGEMFGVTSEVGTCPWNKDHSLVRIGIKASELTKSEEKPLNLVFLIDASGSMCSEDKLPLLQASFKSLLTKLDANDTISIVTYAGDSRVIIQGAKGNETKKLTAAIDSITAEGNTNGSAGIQQAYSIAKKYYKASSNNRIMLATDGDLNVGLTSTDELGDFISKKKETGIYLSVLGFGALGYNDSIMETLADKGNGNYSIIDSAKQAKKVLLDEFTGTINTVATDVKFQVAFDEKAISKYKLIGYENRQLANKDFDNDKKDAGDVGAGQTLTILYEIDSNKVNTAALSKAMTLNIRYKNNYTAKSTKVSYPINCLNQEIVSDDFMFVSTIAELVMYLNESTYAKNTNLSTLYYQLMDLNLEDTEKLEFAELLKNLESNNNHDLSYQYDILPKN